MKKLVSFLCVITLIIGLHSSVYAADTNNPLITIGNITVEAGKSVEVPIIVSNNTGICGAMLNISYDTALILENVKVGDAFSSMTFTAPGNLSFNPVKLVWDSMEEDKSNGSIAILTFKAPSNVGTYNISASYEEGDIVDGNLNPVDVTIANGSVTVKSTTQAPQFSDVSSNAYYYNAVNWAVDKGITTGRTATTFDPDGKCTRAQVVTFLWRA
ncbi:MAG: S-layer homology domain-containing protein, partial [Agathobacter sp.]